MEGKIAGGCAAGQEQPRTLCQTPVNGWTCLLLIDAGIVMPAWTFAVAVSTRYIMLYYGGMLAGPAGFRGAEQVRFKAV